MGLSICCYKQKELVPATLDIHETCHYRYSRIYPFIDGQWFSFESLTNFFDNRIIALYFRYMLWYNLLPDKASII